jgi:hypothetical protein
MFERPLRALAIVVSIFVLAGWSLFAIDEIRSASDHTQAQIAGAKATRQPDPTSREERARERIHNAVREAIDDVNDVLLAPLAFATDDSPSAWARRTAPALLALLLYGFGLAFLARFARGNAHAHHPHLGRT